MNSANPVPPYAAWSTAATNIQDAIAAASAGDVIMVNDGIYRTAGQPVNDSGEANCVAVVKPVTVQSVNGPAATLIAGTAGSMDGGSARCVYLASGATLAGFTLTNGNAFFEPFLDDGYVDNNFGGGVWCESTSATVSNCIIINNFAFDSGGAAFGGTLVRCSLVDNHLGPSGQGGGGAYGSILIDCTLADNDANGADGGGGAAFSSLTNCVLTGNYCGFPAGGAYYCTLNHCTLTSNVCSEFGGGAFICTLNGCVLAGNTAGLGGGGAADSTLNGCVLTGNSAALGGGGAEHCTLNDCTLADNSAFGYWLYIASGGAAEDSVLNNCTLTGNLADRIGGAYISTLNNCIAFYNSDATGISNYDPSSTLRYCCTLPYPAGIGNITNNPLFVEYFNDNLRLQSNSPCINAGDNDYAPFGPDLDGNPRIVGGTVDIGAYEFQTPSSILSYAWAQQYGLSTDGSADYAVCDKTGMNNFQKSVAGLSPSNSTSVLAMFTPVATNNPPGLVVAWHSVNSRLYFVQCSTNLGAQAAFCTIQSNIVGQVGTTSFMDTNAVGTGPYFYRVGIQ